MYGSFPFSTVKGNFGVDKIEKIKENLPKLSLLSTRFEAKTYYNGNDYSYVFLVW